MVTKPDAAALEMVARRADMIATPEQVSAFVMRAVGDKVNARRRRIAELFTAEKHSRSGMLSLVRPATESTASRLVTAPAPIEVHTSEETVSGTISREEARARGCDEEISSDSPPSVTQPSVTHARPAAQMSPVDIHSPLSGEADLPSPVADPPVSREEPTPREVPPPRRHSDAPAPAPVIQPAPQEPAADAATERPTQRPLRHRISRDRTFQVVALAAFVFGALARVLLSMGAPDASAEPLFPAEQTVEAPAPTAR